MKRNRVKCNASEIICEMMTMTLYIEKSGLELSDWSPIGYYKALTANCNGWEGAGGWGLRAGGWEGCPLARA